MAPPPSSDLHRAFAQALLSRRTLPEKTALKLYRRACNAVQGESDAEFSATSLLIVIAGASQTPPTNTLNLRTTLHRSKV